MNSVIEWVNNLVWSNAMIVLCLATGIYFSFRTRLVQLRYLRHMWQLLFSRTSSKEGVSSFQAFTIAIAGRVGTGNISGVATAIAMGGPGAVFWMWVIAFLGAASAFIEATLGQLYKQVKDGEYRGGPAFYIQEGLGIKWFAVVFAALTILSMAFFFPGVQCNNIAESMKTAFRIPMWVSGLLVTLLVGLIIFGGVKRIGKFAELVVPFMAIAYILMALLIIGLNFSEIPATLSLIIRSAFNQEAAYSGIFGSAIAWGVKRGIYSNEAGQGTAPHAAAAAEVSHPVKQGLVQSFSVYVDTLFVCTATAFMILFTQKYNVIDPQGGFLVENLPKVVPGPGFTQNAIDAHFPSFGAGFVAFALFFFAFTTLVAYYYMAETNLSFLVPSRRMKLGRNLIRFSLLLTCFYGSIRTASTAWMLGDIGVGSMAWLNIIAILLLQKPALLALKDYQQQRKNGKDPVFQPSANPEKPLPAGSFWHNK
jgi:AGCS family alanine or glycine:cation symporter